jgi:hypothetical protein
MDQILYRVLSFDGGGIRGLYHAKLLESLQASGLDLAQRADVVAGTEKSQTLSPNCTPMSARRSFRLAGGSAAKLHG